MRKKIGQARLPRNKQGGQARLPRNKQGGQATLEFSLVIGALFLLLLGIVRIMGWFNLDMVGRQEAFYNSRVHAGSNHPGVPVGHSTEELSLFEE